MAKFAAIAAVGRSLEALLSASFEQEEPVPGAQTKVVLVRAVDFDSSAAASVIGAPALSIRQSTTSSCGTKRCSEGRR